MNSEKVRAIIEEITDKPLEREDELLGAGIMDSMMTMILVGRLEDEFSVSFDAEDFTHHNFNSIKAICGLVSGRLHMADEKMCKTP